MARELMVPIKLPADPTNALEAATKQYVDAKVAAGPGGSVVGAAIFNSSNQSIATGTVTALTFPSVLFNQGMTTGGNSITVVSDGYYHITLVANFDSSGDKRRMFEVWVNSTSQARVEGSAYLTNMYWGATVAFDFPLVAGDVITGRGYQNSGSSVVVQGLVATTRLSAMRW